MDSVEVLAGLDAAGAAAGAELAELDESDVLAAAAGLADAAGASPLLELELELELFEASSFTYQPAPLKFNRGAVNVRSRTPPHSGHSVSGSELKL